MKAGALRDRIAGAMLVEPSAVQVTMRNIRERGFLTTGAHGVNAPDMTYLDAARVLVAQILDPSPGRRAPKYVEDFGALPWVNRGHAWCGDPFTLGELLPEGDFDTFEKSVAGLIEVFAMCRDSAAFFDAGRKLRDGTFLKPRCRVEIFAEDMAARIDMADAIYDFHFGLPSLQDFKPEQHHEDFRLGRQAISFVNQEVIALIADGFAEVA